MVTAIVTVPCTNHIMYSFVASNRFYELTQIPPARFNLFRHCTIFRFFFVAVVFVFAVGGIFIYVRPKYDCVDVTRGSDASMSSQESPRLFDFQAKVLEYRWMSFVSEQV